jgi:predicted acetyltransferase
MLHRILLAFLVLILCYSGMADPVAAAQQCPQYRPLVPSEVKLIPMGPEDLPILHRMGKFFVYDLSQYMGDHKDWKLPHDGSYECESHAACKKLDQYVDKAPNHFAFFIYYKNEMAGFILGNLKKEAKNTAEIFIISKFKNQGLGKHIADTIFKKYPGEWDAQSIGEHHASQAVWGEIDPHRTYQTMDKSKVELVLLKRENLPQIQRMARFFLYDELEYMGTNPRWTFPEDGHYEISDLKDYFANIGKDTFPHLIKYNGEPAGFVLVDTKHVYPNTKYNVGEFFVLRKFRGQGLGRYAAEKIFKKYPGIWEVEQMVENCSAIKFWEKVIGKFTHNKYTRALKPVPFLNGRIQVIEQFDSRGR